MGELLWPLPHPQTQQHFGVLPSLESCQALDPVPRSQSGKVPATCTPWQAPCWQAALMAQSMHYLKYPQESREGGIVCPILQMRELKLRGSSWPGRGSAGFGPLALLALRFVLSTTLPLEQSDMCSQGLTLFIVVHTHTSPYLPHPLVTCCTHTAKQTPFRTEPFSSPGSPQAPLLHRRAPQGRAPAPSLGDQQGFSRLGLFLVNSGTSEQPQVRLHILPVLPRAFATNPPSGAVGMVQPRKMLLALEMTWVLVCT